MGRRDGWTRIDVRERVAVAGGGVLRSVMPVGLST
jgi:hypothetical protein